MNENRARDRAKQVVAELHIRGKVDIEAVAEHYGMVIDTVDMVGKRVQEVTIGNRITVRSTLGYRRRRWAIAHGLGHAFLHPTGNHVWLQDSEDRRSLYNEYEYEAEEFAHELMVGTDKYQHTLSRLADPFEIAGHYGVPLDKATSHPLGGFE